MARRRPSDALMATNTIANKKPAPLRLAPSDASSVGQATPKSASSASADDLSSIVSTLERKFQKKHAQQQRQLEQRLKDSMAQALQQLQNQANLYEEHV